MTNTELIILSGTTISLVVNAVQAFRLQRRSFVMAEYSVLEKTCERQRQENRSLHEEIGTLKARTDLQPLMQAIIDWRDEGRKRFDAATETLNANTDALRSLVDSHNRMMERLFPARTDAQH